jgi:integrase
LGLRNFVQLRTKIDKGGRVFREFRLGTKGKKSDGLSKFWASYLREFDLWAVGRSTHVFRHTLIGNLRANGVAEEDVASIVGHSRSSVTAGYGGAYPLSRKAVAIAKVDYGFDVVEALGGAFDPKRHA